MNWETALVLFALTCPGIVILYGGWIFGGWLCDRYDQWKIRK